MREKGPPSLPPVVIVESGAHKERGLLHNTALRRSTKEARKSKEEEEGRTATERASERALKEVEAERWQSPFSL